MMPTKESEKHIRHQISFHEAGARWYADHDQKALAEWSLKMVAEWQAKLMELYPVPKVQ